MSEFKKVKIQTIVEKQIPEFLNLDSPLFSEFLQQYYISQEHQAGMVDLVTNLNDYKNIDFFNEETFYTEKYPCYLEEDIYQFNDTINVSSTTGFPSSYGLIKIDDEIITYTGITSTSFTGCIRGFSGISKDENTQTLVFESTTASNHFSIISSNAATTKNVVRNLSAEFFKVLFNKFKSQFLPGFEDREFSPKVNIKNILTKARDFYISKGTDSSFKLLFDILFAESVDILKPQEYMLSPSDDNYLITKNILVEQVVRDSNSVVLSNALIDQLKGKTLFQNVYGSETENVSSAAIYNVEVRYIDEQYYYEISLDKESFILNYEVTNKTKISEDVLANANTIYVDSTIGFKKSGSFLVSTENLPFPIEVSYNDKTINQFLDVTGVIDSISYNTKIIEDKLLYTFLDDGTKVEFRLVNIIEDVDISNSSNLRVNDKISFSSFGINLDSYIHFNKWIYNYPIVHNIKTISNGIIRLKNDQAIKSFYVGDIVELISTFEETSINVEITNKIENSPSGAYLQIINNPGINYNIYDKLRKKIKKGNSIRTYFSEVNDIPVGIQNTYIDYDYKNLFVSSSGIPFNRITSSNQKIMMSAVGITSVLYAPKHGYFTGEKLYYYSNDQNNFKSGSYFVKRIDENNIKIVYSQNDLVQQKYIKLKPSSNDYISPVGFENSSENVIKNIKNQKLLKKIPLDNNRIEETGIDRSVSNRKIGILLDGSELFSSYLYDENIYYGKIDSIVVEGSGKNYDVVNFSNIIIEDQYGSGCLAHANVIGEVSEIKVISPGVGYQQKPKITITGGNGYGAVLESNLVKTRITSNFKGDLTGVSLSPTNTVKFLNNHNFENGEEVIYKSNSNSNIPSFINNSSYFVGVVDSDEAKFYRTREDALNSTNPIVISGISTGVHSFQSLNVKNTITKVYVKNPGENYSNKLVKIPSTLNDGNGENGINTYDNYIFAKNHNFNSGDLVVYSSTGSSASGLTASSYYYVTVFDENKFKLSYAGVSTSISKDDFNDKKYVDISSVGSGYHTFSYPPIEIKVESLSAIGIASVSTPVLKPIVLGKVESVFVIDGGSKYGSSDILNFHRRPLVSIGYTSITSESVIKPIIIDGSLISVQILNKGKGYGQDTELKVYGSGKYAELEPVIVDGKITDVKILNSGVGYDEKTTVIIERRGSGAKFIANVYKWKINQIEKNKERIDQDDESILTSNDNDELGLSVVSFYPPKNLRINLSDNISNTKLEQPTTGNVILGWAYDGNPIFGPYSVIGNKLRKVNSSYKVISTANNNLRPPFPFGFFLQDYVYDKKSTGGDLDENNGMYIDDDNLPGINYGYFLTINDSKSSSPVYPYVIGPEFKNNPVLENYDSNFNQDRDLKDLDLVRNVGPSFAQASDSTYELLSKVDEKYKQDFIVRNVFPSGITSIRIYNSGKDYKVGDLLVFDNSETGGNGASAEISKIKGKDIYSFEIGISTFKGVKFSSTQFGTLGIATEPHGFANEEDIIISGISKNDYSNLEGINKIFIRSKTVGLATDVKPTSITGNWTSIVVNDVSGFEVDDFIGINTETLRITNISEEESKLYVTRPTSIGSTHYSSSSSVVLLPHTFQINKKINEPRNISVYFNPNDNLGIWTSGTTYYKKLNVYEGYGTLKGSERDYIGIETALIKVGDYVYGSYIGAGTTVTQVGINSVKITPQSSFTTGITTTTIIFRRDFYDKIVPGKSIYIKDHTYTTGQELVYNVGVGGTGINVYDGSSYFKIQDGQKVYAINLGKDYIGISTNSAKSNVGINTLFFIDPKDSIGNAHSFKTNYTELTGTAESYSINVFTTQNHDLLNGDKVKFNSVPSVKKTETIRYDSNIRKLTTGLINFDANIGVNTVSSEISIPNNKLKTGDKVVYYTNSNTEIGGLTNNKIYFVLKENYDSIKLCEYQSDINKRNYVSLSSVGVGTQSISLINPPLSIVKGNILEFSLDKSLTNIDGSLNFDFKIYKDRNFQQEIESFSYSGIGSYIRTLDTAKYDYPRELYYNVVITDSSVSQTYSLLEQDDEVSSRNKITIVDSEINYERPIVSSSNTSFKINLNKKPEGTIKLSSSGTLTGITTISYNTSSKNSFGPISNLKINYGGLNYKKTPKIVSIATTSGSGAILKAESDKIGKIKQLDRIKDGFDFLSDYTLQPFLSSPTIVQIKDIQRIDYVGIVTGGRGYSTPPSLRVLDDNNNIVNKVKLSCKLNGTSVSEVIIDENTNDLSKPLKIIPIRNSNGFEIDYIETNGNIVTLELINSDPVFYPLITTGIGTTSVVFPFNVGDKIFIENCRQINSGATDTFNSKDYNYSFFTITSVDEGNCTITYDMSEVKPNFNGTLATGEANYNSDFGYGFVINKKQMPVFEMVLIDDLSYVSAEKVSSPTFTGNVMDNGWDNDINQLRLNNSSGTIKNGDKLKGQYSLLNGTVESFTAYNLRSKLGILREKINNLKPETGLLNEFQQRISDNDYYQKFSYSLRSSVPYSDWKEPVLSLVHPAGYKSFSDLTVVSTASTDMRVKISDSSLKLVVSIDTSVSMYEKTHFSLVTEDDDNYFDNSIERVIIGAEVANVSGLGFTGPVFGTPLRPYILNKTNKVLDIDDISGQFDGSNSYINLGQKVISVASTEPYYVGISTIGLQVGDYVGLSTYLQPNSQIVSIIENKIQLNKIHRFNYGVPINTSADVVEEVEDGFSYPYTGSFDSGVYSFDQSGITFDSN